ncbi:transcription factor protein [Ciona intestinalis]
MVLKVKSKLSSATVSVTKAGRVTTVEKWKTDWFHEISELFHLTTDQVTPCLSSGKPTLERVRALESKAKLNTVLSLIERYIKGSMNTHPAIIKNSNSNSNNNSIQFRKKQHHGDCMPWTMVDPNEVCPVDYFHQPKEDKQTWNVEEAIEILAADNPSKDIITGSLTPEHSCSDSEDYLTKFFPSITNLRSYESHDTVNPQEAMSSISVKENHRNHMRNESHGDLIENNREQIDNVRKRKRSDDTIVVEDNSNAKPEVERIVLMSPSGSRTLTVPRLVQGRKVVMQNGLVTIPNASVLLKRLKLNAENLKQKQRSISTDATANENDKRGLQKLGEPIRVRHTSLHSHDQHETKQPITSSSAMKYETIDLQSLLGFDDDVIVDDDVTVLPGNSATNDKVACGSTEGHLAGVLKEIESQNKPKRKYNKKPKVSVRMAGSENDKELVKPPLPYNQLIYLAFKHAGCKQLTVRQIYKFVTSRFPYYAYANLNWQNAIRHQLCCSNHYQKILLHPNEVANDKQGKYAWAIPTQVSREKLDDDLTTHLEKDGVIDKIRLAMPQDTGDFEELFGDCKHDTPVISDSIDLYEHLLQM